MNGDQRSAELVSVIKDKPMEQNLLACEKHYQKKEGTGVQPPMNTQELRPQMITGCNPLHMHQLMNQHYAMTPPNKYLSSLRFHSLAQEGTE